MNTSKLMHDLQKETEDYRGRFNMACENESFEEMRDLFIDVCHTNDKIEVYLGAYFQKANILTQFVNPIA